MDIIFGLLIATGIGFWLSSDAKTCKRNSTKWFWMGFLFGLVAVAVYYLRKDIYTKN